MPIKQPYGVCYEDAEKGWVIQAVYNSYDVAFEEAAVWTLETGVEHVVKPVKPKEEVSYESKHK